MRLGWIVSICTAVGLATASAPAVAAPQNPAEQARQDLQSLQQSFAKVSADDTAAFQAETGPPNLGQSLQPAWLANHPNFDAERRRLRAYHDAVVRFTDLQARRHGEADAAIDKAVLPANLKTAFRAAFDQSFEADWANDQKALKLNTDLLQELDAELAFLAGAQARWSIQNGQLLFRQPADLATHTAHLAAIQKIGAELNSVAQAAK